ncbi:DUF4387 domain-containing protein [Streptomyces sp. AD2-2]|nr:DUF4387 domain-containing protein [Streptomyces sp. AD2-2]
MPESTRRRPLLADYALEIRSKNAGPFWVTMETFMKDAAGYAIAADEDFLNERSIADLYQVDARQVQIFRIPDLNVVKISFPGRSPRRACATGTSTPASTTFPSPRCRSRTGTLAPRERTARMSEPAAAPGVSGEQLDRLRQLDTPTVCNALDLVDPDFDLPSFTSRSLRCLYPTLPPVVGFARTATIRAISPPPTPRRQPG